MSDEYCVIANARSGHHAVVSWIAMLHLGMLPDAYSLPPFLINDITHTSGMCAHGHPPVCFEYLLYPQRVYNTEHLPPAEAHRLVTALRKEMPVVSTLTYVIVVRDPLNALASSVKHGTDVGPNAWRAWCEQARYLLPDAPPLGDVPVVPVNFNRWVTQKDYRKGLACDLDLTFDDEDDRRAMDHVNSTGGGSSFDGTQIERIRPGVLRRYAMLPGLRAENYLDAEVFRLCRAIWPEIERLYHEVHGRAFPIRHRTWNTSGRG